MSSASILPTSSSRRPKVWSSVSSCFISSFFSATLLLLLLQDFRPDTAVCHADLQHVSLPGLMNASQRLPVLRPDIGVSLVQLLQRGQRLHPFYIHFHP